MRSGSVKVPPRELFDGPITVLAPHPDDEVLGCGAMLAAISNERPVHVVYLTDGAGSPVPPAPWIGPRAPNLPEIRAGEARRAMQVLGVAPDRLRLLGLPDGNLFRMEKELRDVVVELVREHQARYLFTPFRFDQHRDHLAANRAAIQAISVLGAGAPQLVEYFVYYRLRFLPGGDLREYIARDLRVTVDVEPFSALKRRALECFESQTTRFFEWQVRPNLTRRLLDEVCQLPESFVMYSKSRAGGRVFERRAAWIRVAHAIEPWLKRPKDRALAIARSMRSGWSK